MSSKPFGQLNTVSIDAELADHLENDAEFRREYIRLFAQSAVAAEIRGLRKLRRLKQADVARLVKTGQSAISRIEKANYDAWTFKTLLAIAIELRARLRIQMEPIENVTQQLRTPTSADAAFDIDDLGGTSELAEYREQQFTTDDSDLDGDSTARETVING